MVYDIPGNVVGITRNIPAVGKTRQYGDAVEIGILTDVAREGVQKSA
jgi:hypothetical protein